MLSPAVISASRSTDIPAFYADWFFHRLKVGYSAWRNPFNPSQVVYVHYENTRFIVFWSKNPEPLLAHIDTLGAMGIGCYIQYSLNDYQAEGYEPNVPSVQQRLDTFRRLVDRLGEGRVVWRFDPLLLTAQLGVSELLARVEGIGDALHGYTERLVFSFADIAPYRRVAANLRAAGVPFREWASADMRAFAEGLQALNAGWGYELQTCAEREELGAYGVSHSQCIDWRLIARFRHGDAQLMDALGITVVDSHAGLFGGGEGAIPEGAVALSEGVYATFCGRKDSGQRAACACVRSKDIGQYNTCPHGCVYCYANTGQQVAMARYRRSRESWGGEFLVE